jgi:hypothetical protein
LVPKVNRCHRGARGAFFGVRSASVAPEKTNEAAAIQALSPWAPAPSVVDKRAKAGALDRQAT